MSAEKIAATLETDIVSGIFRPGEELKQGELAARFSVSRIPVRDALQLMAARGLIDLERNRRARVISLTPRRLMRSTICACLRPIACGNQSGGWKQTIL